MTSPTNECILPKGYCKVKDLATLKLFLDKYADSMTSIQCTGDLHRKPSLLSHTLKTCTPCADFLVKQNENDIDNFWSVFCEVKSTECLDRIFKNVIVDNHITIPKHFLQLVPKGVTSFPSAEMDIPFFLDYGADPNVVVGDNDSNFLEEHFFELSDECIGAFLTHGARLDRTRLRGAENKNNFDNNNNNNNNKNNNFTYKNGKKKQKKEKKIKNSAEVAHQSHAMLEYVRRRTFDVRPLVEQGPILHNMVINITPYVSFSLTKLFARQGAYINKLEHLYRILYATLNNYADCGGKRHDEVKQILHFLVKPKDFTYFLPSNKLPPSTNPLTSLPTCVLNQTLSLVCERLYDILNCMLVCKSFHNFFSSELTDCIWYNVSAVAPLFASCGKDSRKTQNGKQTNTTNGNGIGKRANKSFAEELEEMILGANHKHSESGEDTEEDKTKDKEDTNNDSEDDEEEEEEDIEDDEDDDDEEEDEEEEMEYDSDDSEPDHMNSDLNPNDCFSDYWSSIDFSLHSDSQNVLLRAIRCKVPAFIIKALLLSPENKNFVDEFQRNPIHWCAMNDTQDIDVLKELLVAGIPFDKQDKFLRTPLHYALLRGKNEIADMLASCRPPDSASRGLRASFDPTTIQNNKPIYETPPDCNNFVPASRLVEDEELIQMMQNDTPKVTRKKITRQCYLPSKNANYPKRFLKMDTSFSTVALRGVMGYSRVNEPFVDLLDCHQFWSQRHIYHPSLHHSLLSDSSISDCVFLSGSDSLGVWDMRVPRYLVNLFSLPNRVSSFGRTNDKICYTCRGRAYYTDLRSNGAVEIGEFSEDIVATYANDKMYWMSGSQISVHDLTSLSPLSPIQGICLDDTDPQDRRPMVKSNENTLVCCVRDRVFACDIATHAREEDAPRMRMVCEVPSVATSLAIDKQSKRIAVGTMGLSGVYLHDATKFYTEGETEEISTIPTCFPMCHDDHSCHIDDECYPTQIELHLGAIWSTTSCGRISVVPNFYKPIL